MAPKIPLSVAQLSLYQPRQPHASYTKTITMQLTNLTVGGSVGRRPAYALRQLNACVKESSHYVSAHALAVLSL